MELVEFLNRIENLCEQKGLKRQVVYTSCGVGKNFGVSVRNGSEPSIGKVFALASALGCSVDYLLGRTENPAINNDSALNTNLDDNEKKLLTGYRELNDMGKEQALIYVTEFLLQNARFTQKSYSNDAE